METKTETIRSPIVVTSAQKVGLSFKEDFQLPDWIEYFSCYKVMACEGSQEYIDAAKENVVMGEKNILQVLDPIFEEKVASSVRPFVTDCKAVCMLELTDFPYVYVWVDKRDQTEHARTSFTESFASTLEKIYTEGYPEHHIPLLVINKFTSSATLKIINMIRADVYECYKLKEATKETE